jgi:hypothetical protein
MNLPIYQQVTIRHYSIEELEGFLTPELNVKHPVVLNIRALDHDQQREYIGVIENYYDTNGISYKFPYAIYIVSDHEPSITNMPLLSRLEDLPKFYLQKEAKVTTKENQLLGKNRLLQLQLKNTNSVEAGEQLATYASNHRTIFDLEEERRYYTKILNKLGKRKR